jgi:hypothetical protein
MQELLVLFVSLGNIPGKHSPVEDDEDHECDEPREGNPDKQPQDYENKEYDGEKPGQAVYAVSSLHKFGKTISEFIKHK